MTLDKYPYHGCLFTQYRGGSEDMYIARPVKGKAEEAYYKAIFFGERNIHNPYRNTMEGIYGYAYGYKRYQMKQLLEGKVNGI